MSTGELHGLKKCPGCTDGWMEASIGVLDQSGMTHLETTTWECGSCGRKEWQRTDSHWVMNKEVAMEPQVVKGSEKC